MIDSVILVGWKEHTLTHTKTSPLYDYCFYTGHMFGPTDLGDPATADPGVPRHGPRYWFLFYVVSQYEYSEKCF